MASKPGSARPTSYDEQAEANAIICPSLRQRAGKQGPNGALCGEAAGGDALRLRHQRLGTSQTLCHVARSSAPS